MTAKRTTWLSPGSGAKSGRVPNWCENNMPMNLAHTVAAIAFLFAQPAMAACSRPIEVPVAPIGQSIFVKGDTVSGAYYDMLTTLRERTGCIFHFRVVPRMRLEAMFESGKADLLVAATHSARRVRAGQFIPMVETRATLLSLTSGRAPLRSMDDIVGRTELRVAVVRGFDYGEAYQELLKKLAAQGRLFQEADPLTVARLLNKGMADLTIMPHHVMISAIKSDARVASMETRLRIETLEEMPWIQAGVYISSNSLNAHDRSELTKGLSTSAREGELWHLFQRYYSPAVLSLSIRPL